ncbi:MAG: hypothetical protein J0I34_12620 [Pseudonocardia sp.]|uniref:hypothetical protein n=1 Tax=unclassified Pseudonocardia TaxID=2619320 RepID=UPI00086E77F7|nr:MULTISPECIES: hypothetical protein [unclassified Pseudonocardia]MBN9109618.1 hypothetical protein [Pseudonocardia sp.]ODU24655.1 MAG: hypothetical protein ABS80_11810 [Pseudonocardia sp. SCN 72-51]ODU99077.1 MAG: hypothetical protein ABT15_32475 [Pseudonocardia sp. SCN 73-27]
MDVVVSALPGDGGSAGYADLAIVAPFGVVLLDGASAFEPVDVHPATYARTLGTSITALLHGQPDIPIADAVAEAIRRTTASLNLRAGASPSSTVAILRTNDDVVDFYVLGDSTIHYGVGEQTHQLVDDRIEQVAQQERDNYIRRLRAGYGYDDAHRSALADLQGAQRSDRNVEGGYWIAETEPAAAYRGLTRSFKSCRVGWAVLATDGAADVIDHLGLGWAAVAGYKRAELNRLLGQLHAWEAGSDPYGCALPRAKRHDDKTIVAIRSLGSSH